MPRSFTLMLLTAFPMIPYCHLLGGEMQHSGTNCISRTNWTLSSYNFWALCPLMPLLVLKQKLVEKRWFRQFTEMCPVASAAIAGHSESFHMPGEGLYWLAQTSVTSRYKRGPLSHLMLLQMVPPSGQCSLWIFKGTGMVAKGFAWHLYI